LFTHGEDILYYNNIGEAIVHIENLLKNDDLRNHLANNIYNKVNNLHRAETRTNQLISIYKELKNN
jgi:spore maturation protein CgeB